MAPVSGTCEKPYITPQISNIDIQETDPIHFSGERHYTEVEKDQEGQSAIPSGGIFQRYCNRL
jgi:hypothetical protein